MTPADYVWARLPLWQRRIAGRAAVDVIVDEALSVPFAGDCDDQTGYVLERCRKHRSLGGILLAAILPIVVETVCRLIAEWLKDISDA